MILGKTLLLPQVLEAGQLEGGRHNPDLPVGACFPVSQNKASTLSVETPVINLWRPPVPCRRTPLHTHVHVHVNMGAHATTYVIYEVPITLQGI